MHSFEVKSIGRLSLVSYKQGNLDCYRAFLNKEDSVNCFKVSSFSDFLFSSACNKEEEIIFQKLWECD